MESTYKMQESLFDIVADEIPASLFRSHVLKYKTPSNGVNGVATIIFSSLLLIVSNQIYREDSNIKCNLIGNKMIYHSDDVGETPGGAAPTASSFSI